MGNQLLSNEKFIDNELIEVNNEINKIDPEKITETNNVVYKNKINNLEKLLKIKQNEIDFMISENILLQRRNDNNYKLSREYINDDYLNDEKSKLEIEKLKKDNEILEEKINLYTT